MKKLLYLVSLWMAVAGRAQITDAGWFNAEGTIPAAFLGSSFTGGGGAGISGAGSAWAENATPEIDALARGLEYDPVRIYNYVHDHIRHVLYFGAKKGAQLTLLERSGNDFDQCALLVALLRASGHSPSYQFGFLQMPFDSADHNDLRHWLQLTVPNTVWTNTLGYVVSLLAARGHPAYFDLDPITSSNVGIQHVWVKLSVGGTNYLLDPAFKVSEPVAGIDLHVAMGLDTNALVTAAGGTSTADYAQSLSESAVRNKLRDYTTSLLAYLQSNAPNASVENITGGWRITPSTSTALSQSLLFPIFDNGGFAPVVDWSNEPTNLMTQLTITLAGTNYQWWMPALQGQRLALTFDSNGVARLWQNDTLLVQKTTTGTNLTASVSLGIDHPHGLWNFNNGTLISSTNHDQLVATEYQRTNADYALVYGFEVSSERLVKRQVQLDGYRQQGYADTATPVVDETLNVMGLGWLEQTELAAKLIAGQGGTLHQHHHRIGRMAQEKNKGYYIDLYMQVSGEVADSGNTLTDVRRKNRVFDLEAYFSSALEHGLLEQSQPSNLVAASTVKMLQLAGTNGLKVFLLTAANAASVTNQLTNYALSELSAYLSQGYVLLLPQDGKRTIAGTGSWKGYGALARRISGDTYTMSMLISGNYNGGYPSFPYWPCPDLVDRWWVN